MNQLPAELVLNVCECLQTKDIANLQAVSTTLRRLLYKKVWRNSRLLITDRDEEANFEQDHDGLLQVPQTDLVMTVDSNKSNVKALTNMICQFGAYGYPLEELQYLSVQCSSESLDGREMAQFLSTVGPSMLCNLKQIDVYSTVKCNQQPQVLVNFLQKFKTTATANWYLDAQSALEPFHMPTNVQKLILSTIKGTEEFDLHHIIDSQYLSNVESLHLVTDKNHPITKHQLMAAVDTNPVLKSLAVTPHCVENEDDGLHWTLPANITDFQLHVPSFDQEWSPSMGSINSDRLVSLRVPSNGENRLYNMRFPNLKQLHLEGTSKDAFKLPPGIETFCGTSARLEQLQLSGFSMSDVSQIVNQFATSLKSVVLQNTVKNGREYNVYQWYPMPNLQFLVADYSPLTSNQIRTTKRLLNNVPRTLKMCIIDHKDVPYEDSLWLTPCASTVHDGISTVDLLEGVDHREWACYEVDAVKFYRETRNLDL